MPGRHFQHHDEKDAIASSFNPRSKGTAILNCRKAPCCSAFMHINVVDFSAQFSVPTDGTQEKKTKTIRRASPRQYCFVWSKPGSVSVSCGARTPAQRANDRCTWWLMTGVLSDHGFLMATGGPDSSSRDQRKASAGSARPTAAVSLPSQASLQPRGLLSLFPHAL